MKTTTLNKIREHNPCTERWEVLLRALGKTKADDEPLPFTRILDILGLTDALWCCRSAPEYDRDWRLYAVWCARQVQHLMTDPRSIAALDVAERYALGEASAKEMDAAWDAAGAAAREAGAAWVTALAAAQEVARDAALAVAVAAARDTAWEAAREAERGAAVEAAGAAQEAEFRKVCEEKES